MSDNTEKPQLIWMPTKIEERDDQAILTGYIAAPEWPEPGEYRLSLNRQSLSNAKYGLKTPALQKKFSNPRAGALGFQASLHRNEISEKAGDAVLRVVHADSSRYARVWDHFFLSSSSNSANEIPLPPPELSFRVMAVRDPVIFQKWGYSIKRKYEEAIQPYLPTEQKNPVLLDWGCGCGRLARHFQTGYEYYGVDIDPEAIEWCRRHLRWGRFSTQDLRAETPFSDDYFDIVIGNSVFTHLGEASQFCWLRELLRIAKPGAVIAVSVNCATSVFNAGYPPAVVKTLRDHHFCDAGRDRALTGVTDNDEYYRAIFHTHKYIYGRWGRYFDVLEVLPGFVANMQDLVIMRPRK